MQRSGVRSPRRPPIFLCRSREADRHERRETFRDLHAIDRRDGRLYGHVNPASLTLKWRQRKSFTVTFTRTAAALNAYTGGQLTWKGRQRATTTSYLAQPGREPLVQRSCTGNEVPRLGGVLRRGGYAETDNRARRPVDAHVALSPGGSATRPPGFLAVQPLK